MNSHNPIIALMPTTLNIICTSNSWFLNLLSNQALELLVLVLIRMALVQLALDIKVGHPLCPMDISRRTYLNPVIGLFN